MHRQTEPLGFWDQALIPIQNLPPDPLLGGGFDDGSAGERWMRDVI